jgi:carboxylesterase
MLHGPRRTAASGKLLGEGDPGPFEHDGRAPCFLAFHGFTGSVSEIRPLVDAVLGAGHAVRVPLLPGHGTRPDDLQAMSFDAWCDAMRAELELARARYGKVVLCGFSLGSLIAMHLAATAPKADVAALVVLGNAITLKGYSSIPLGLMDRWKIPVPDWYLVKPRVADMTDRDAAKKIRTYDRHPLRAAMEVFRAGRRVQAEVKDITCPTLILHGQKDRVCGVENARWLERAIGAEDVTVRVFAKSAHLVAADVEKDDVAAETLAFLARVDLALLRRVTK